MDKTWINLSWWLCLGFRYVNESSRYN